MRRIDAGVSGRFADGLPKRGLPGREPGAIAGLALLVLIWGLSVPAMKLGLETVPPFTLGALRYLAAAPCFVFVIWRRKLPPPRLLLAMAGLGVLGIVFGQATQILGIARTSASLATVITATIPLFTVILAAMRLAQRLTARHLFGLAVALGGVAAAAFSGPDAFASADLVGDVLLLLCSISIALYYVLGTELAPYATPLVVAAWSSLAGVPGLVVLAGWELRAAPLHPAPVAIGVVLYLGLLTTVAGMWIWLTCLRRLPVRIAASTQYLQPLVGVAASAALFGDPIGPMFGFGTALVLAGIALVSWPARR